MVMIVVWSRALLMLAALGVAQGKQKAQPVRVRMNPRQSLIAPYMDEGGRSESWAFHKNYFAASYGSDAGVYLTTPNPNQVGAIIAKHPLKMSDWRIDTFFEISRGNRDYGKQAGNGLAVWVTKNKEYVPGDFFGRESVVDGAVVFVSTKAMKGVRDAAPFLGVSYGQNASAQDVRKTASLEKGTVGEKRLLRLQYMQGVLKVFYGTEVSNLRELMSLSDVHVDPNSYLCFSSQTSGDASNSHRIINITTMALGMPPRGGQLYSPGSGQGKSPILVWVFFVAVLLAILYYLYTNQGKRGKASAKIFKQ